MAGMPKGLVGALEGKGFGKPKKSSAKKELTPALAAAAKRKLSAKEHPKKSDGDGDELAGAPMSYVPGVVK